VFQLGDIRIDLISDGTVMVDGGGPFGLVPKALWQHVLAPNDENLVPQALTSLLIRVGGRNIVVDAGIGNRLNEKLRKIWRINRPRGGLVDALARLGLRPEDIDMLVNTHLHLDHAGGNMIEDEAGELRPTFPNAEYVVQRREYEDAMRPNERTRATYWPSNYQPLYEAGQLRLLDGDTELAPGVHGIVTPGHTPGLMCILFERDGQQALFCADMAAYAFHLERLAWIPSYDVEPLVSLETKRRWQQWALETGALLIFEHDPHRPAGRMVLDESGKPRVEPVAVEFA